MTNDRFAAGLAAPRFEALPRRNPSSLDLAERRLATRRLV